MSNWTATNALRFANRISSSTDAVVGNTIEWRTRILQQKWENIVQVPNGNFEIVSEWRDVPVVEESDER